MIPKKWYMQAYHSHLSTDKKLATSSVSLYTKLSLDMFSKISPLLHELIIFLLRKIYNTGKTEFLSYILLLK